MVPLTREVLDQLTCHSPDCDHTEHTGPMYLKSRCHPTAGLEVIYESGVLTASCLMCNTVTACVAVKEK
jgi:hypothetical protein